MITDAEDYFSKGCGRCPRFATADCSARRWASGLASLRRMCLESGLAETAKWGHPVYMHSGRNVAILGAFRSDFRINFFNPALMKDPAGVLERPGPNSQHPGMIRFAGNTRPAEMEQVILSYLAEATGYAEAGIMPERSGNEIILPDELSVALESDAELSEAFHKLTPGRQRSYVINLGSAKQPATRSARIAKFRNRILSGKGATER